MHVDTIAHKGDDTFTAKIVFEYYINAVYPVNRDLLTIEPDELSRIAEISWIRLQFERFCECFCNKTSSSTARIEGSLAFFVLVGAVV